MKHTLYMEGAIDWTMSASLNPHSYVEAPTASVTIFGERVFKEAIRLKWGH